MLEWEMLVYLTRVFQVCARSLHCVPRETGHRSVSQYFGCCSVRVAGQREGSVPVVRPSLRKEGDRPTAFRTTVAVGVQNSTFLFAAGACVPIVECCRNDMTDVGVLHLDTLRNCRWWVVRVGPLLLSYSCRAGYNLSGLARRTRSRACSFRFGRRRRGGSVFSWCGRRRRG